MFATQAVSNKPGFMQRAWDSNSRPLSEELSYQANLEPLNFQVR